MKLKRIIIGAVNIITILYCCLFNLQLNEIVNAVSVTIKPGGIDVNSKDVNAIQYTYEIIPLLEPFNEYFYIKTRRHMYEILFMHMPLFVIIL